MLVFEEAMADVVTGWRLFEKGACWARRGAAAERRREDTRELRVSVAQTADM